MAAVIYTDKENGGFTTPVPSKLRGRLKSAPGVLPADKCLKTPFPKKELVAPLQSGRKALGTVSNIASTPLVPFASKDKSKPLAVQPQTKLKSKPQPTGEYPETEKFIPYNPLDFESFQVPEEVRLSHLCLAGLSSLPLPALEDDFEEFDTHLEMSPLKRQSDFSAELDAFLQTVSELTVELPPELDC